MQQQQAYNTTLIERFTRMHASGRLAHAYLFVGPAYTGRSDTANALAKLVNCTGSLDEAFCDACSSCTKINSGQHPDVHRLDGTQNTSIKIGEVRELIARMNLRAFEAAVKVFIIHNAESLTTEAANALLKMLEEPSANSLIILTTRSLSNNLDTIVSRCHVIYFYPLSNDDAAQRLQREHNLNISEARFLAAYSEGCYLKALQLSKEQFHKKKNRMLDIFLSPRFDEKSIKAISADPQRLEDTLQLLLSWTRDLMAVCAGASNDQLIHSDRADDLQRIKNRYNPMVLRSLVNEITDVSRSYHENFNVRIALSLLKEKLCQT